MSARPSGARQTTQSFEVRCVCRARWRRSRARQQKLTEAQLILMFSYQRTHVLATSAMAMLDLLVNEFPKLSGE